MWTPSASGNDPRHDGQGQLALRLQALNARIGGLSTALGVDLGDAQQLQSLLGCVPASRVVPGAAPGPATGAERRLARKRLELCGLVVMRYGLARHLVEVLGRQRALPLLEPTAPPLRSPGTSNSPP